MHLLFLIDAWPSDCPSERTEHSLPHRVTSDFFFNLVDLTCPRVLVQSTWNLFRSTVYELKLCTPYFWSMSIRPSVSQNGRNIAPKRVRSDFFQSCGLNLSQGFSAINLKPFQINCVGVGVVHLLFLIDV